MITLTTSLIGFSLKPFLKRLVIKLTTSLIGFSLKLFLKRLTVKQLIIRLVEAGRDVFLINKLIKKEMDI
ncbi:hypothetical protein MSBR2_2079 [Methanosarcina barkeri 227]|uniref:Uncharacterized protein n=1 Tax=Methanosarcina barkeri 227 TaxID=1434106 RepID=A0A0E3R2T2_METBA|nr:hypothetical protein MSBR2_2079 [Methanosarcina barkeri 227]